MRAAPSRAGAIPRPAGAGLRQAHPGNGAPAYDYVLAVGPGRSGSMYLYRLLNAHPAFVVSAIKEGHYYRSPQRFDHARRRLQARRAMLLDVANTAWADPRLARVTELRRRGHRILPVVLLRRHRERAALRESLTAPGLKRLFGLGADVLTIAFPALVRHPGEVLAAIVGLCGTAGFEPPPAGPVNASARPRHPLLAGAGKLTAIVLRGIGAHRLLQALKDRPRVMRLFFLPAEPPACARPGAAAMAVFDGHYEGCLATLAARGERLGDGLWFTPGGAAGSASDEAAESAAVGTGNRYPRGAR